MEIATEFGNTHFGLLV